MMTLRWGLLGFVILILAGCTAVSSDKREGQVADVVTIQPRDTAVPTVEPTIAPTIAATNTATMLPTDTAVPTAAATATVKPSPSPTPIQPTPTATAVPNVSGIYSGEFGTNKFCTLQVIQTVVDAVDVELTCRNDSPSPLTGHFVQTLPLVENTAVYQTSDFGGECTITFAFAEEVVQATQSGSWVECGFGVMVDVTGELDFIEWRDPVLSCQPAECEPTPYAPPAPRVHHESDSPVDTWTAVAEEGYFGDTDVEVMRLRVTHTQNGTEWIADEKALLDGFDIFNEPKPLHWSQDGRYLYFTHGRYNDGCGLPFNITDLQRLDLATGAVTAMSVPSNWVAFSPDDQSLAYLANNQLIIRNLADGREQTIPLDTQIEPPGYAFFDDLTWSADSQAVAMVVLYNPCEVEDAIHDGVLAIYLNEAGPTQLLQLLDTRIRNLEAWPAWNLIQLDFFGDVPSALLNMETGELTAVSP